MLKRRFQNISRFTMGGTQALFTRAVCNAGNYNCGQICVPKGFKCRTRTTPAGKKGGANNYQEWARERASLLKGKPDKRKLTAYEFALLQAGRKRQQAIEKKRKENKGKRTKITQKNSPLSVKNVKEVKEKTVSPQNDLKKINSIVDQFRNDKRYKDTENGGIADRVFYLQNDHLKDGKIKQSDPEELASSIKDVFNKTRPWQKGDGEELREVGRKQFKYAYSQMTEPQKDALASALKNTDNISPEGSPLESELKDIKKRRQSASFQSSNFIVKSKPVELKTASDREACAKQELNRALQSSDKKRTRDWEDEAKRTRVANVTFSRR